MDFAGFVENFPRVILQRGPFVEMYRDGKLARIHLNDGRRCGEQLWVVGEVLHTESGRHDQQLHRHAFLQTQNEAVNAQNEESAAKNKELSSL